MSNSNLKKIYQFKCYRVCTDPQKNILRIETSSLLEIVPSSITLKWGNDEKTYNYTIVGKKAQKEDELYFPKGTVNNGVEDGTTYIYEWKSEK